MRDPVLLEIVKNAFFTIGEEMGLAVVRSAYSTAIKEAGDATSAIFDVDGQLITQSQRAPLYHLSSMRPSLLEVLKDYPPDTLRDGDVFMCNDPYRGGIHSNDVTLFKPVFLGGRLSFFTAALVHVADIGGLSAGGLPATATEMYHEGLILPPLKFYDAGEPSANVVKIIEANSRTPEKVMGDIRAMLAAANVGAARLSTLTKKYGYSELHGICQELLAYSEKRTRQEIQRMPQGVYQGSFIIDDDGVEHRPQGFKVQVTVRIHDSTFEVDLTGTDGQARGPINASVSQSMSGVVYGLRCLIDPMIPMNEGCYRPLKVYFPLGSLANPRPPAACNSRIATVMAIIEAMLKALSGAYPEKAVASSGNVHVFTMSGVDQRAGRIWTFLMGGSGSIGARSTKDGVDVEGALILGSASGARSSVEAYEMEYPLLFERVQLWQDSGGAGKWRGGLGVRKEVKLLDRAEVTARIADRSRFPPPGVFGGQPGRGGSWVVNMDKPGEATLPSKVTGVALSSGDTFTMLSSGGGGFGVPWERDPKLVLQDIRDHKVSIEAAAREYGIAVDSKTGRLDEAQTRSLRARMNGEKALTPVPLGQKAVE